MTAPKERRAAIAERARLQASRKAQKPEGMCDDCKDDFWGPVISAYSRKQAIEDGVLVDVTPMAKEAGFNIPVAITSAVEGIVEPSEELKKQGQSREGRLWDIFMILRYEIKKAPKGTDTVYFDPLFIMKPGGAAVPEKLWAKMGPGDDAQPVLTVMKLGED